MSKCILIIDDSESIRELVALTLESAGFFVKKAIDGKDALSYLINNDTQLIITDLHMPNLDGIQLIGEIRKIEQHTTTPILLLTTELSAIKKEEARMAGATGWIVKPFNQQKLLEIIKRLIGGSN
ncbi:MAG: two-component system response regulator [Bacteroidetes bacterium HGW-Bacteroidetes-21]|jgi:two-component system chemotaxis response regulator CheY|nr:MAG: two-component system response regulator [Bacteroidetes bacterium HGW-Bacteroidetes-21]